jgi:hypothetical protein
MLILRTFESVVRGNGYSLRRISGIVGEAGATGRKGEPEPAT